jgi:hypothetical protein
MTDEVDHHPSTHQGTTAPILVVRGQELSHFRGQD